MSFAWNAFLETHARISPADAAIVDLGDLAGELEAARSASIVAPLAHYGLIAVSGEDAANFLHNQFTSDITHLAPGQAQHSAWCSAKGRMLASFLVFRVADTYFLRLDGELAASVLKRLQMFVLRARVKLVDATTGRALVGVSGPRAEAALSAAGLAVPTAAMDVTSGAAGTVVRIAEQRYELAIEHEQLPMVWQQLAAEVRPAGVAAWRWLEIDAGLPVVGAATREEFVPQMANFEQIGGVSFHKGCYPGQEVIARTQYLGKVKRHLYRVSATAAMSPGMPMYSPAAPDQICGQIINAAPAPGGGNVALAVLQESAAASGEIRLRAPDGPPLSRATPVAPTLTVAN